MKMINRRFALASLVAALAIAAGKPDFSGEWKLNTGKSDFGQRPAPISAVIKAVHKDPSLKLTRTLVTDSGQMTTETVYSTDGKETTNRLPAGGEMKNTARWDGSAVVIETPVNGAGFTIRWRWTLSEDGKTLSTVRTFGPGEPGQTEVYEKK